LVGNFIKLADVTVAPHRHFGHPVANFLGPSGITPFIQITLLPRRVFFVFRLMQGKDMRDETKKYDVKEAAARLGVQPLTLRRMIKAREIGFYRPRARGPIFFFETHLQDFERRHVYEPQNGLP
jgi:excisionase family DNA binding protein